MSACDCGPACDNADLDGPLGRYCDVCDRRVHSLCVGGPTYQAGVETYACLACRDAAAAYWRGERP